MDPTPTLKRRASSSSSSTVCAHTDLLDRPPKRRRAPSTTPRQATLSLPRIEGSESPSLPWIARIRSFMSLQFRPSEQRKKLSKLPANGSRKLLNGSAHPSSSSTSTELSTANGISSEIDRPPPLEFAKFDANEAAGQRAERPIDLTAEEEAPSSLSQPDQTLESTSSPPDLYRPSASSPTEPSSSNPISPIYPQHILTTTNAHASTSRPTPRRPDISSVERPSRQYAWESLSAPSPARKARSRPTRLHHSGDSRRDEEVRAAAVMRKLQMLEGGGGGGDQRAGEKTRTSASVQRAKAMFGSLLPKGKKKEQEWRGIVNNQGGDSKEAYRLLLSATKEKTLEEAIRPAKTVYDPVSTRRIADSARLESRTRPADIAEILERVRIEQAEEEEKIARRLRPSAPHDLSEDQQAEYDDAMDEGRSFQRTFKNESCSAESLARLRPGQWLNDEVINFYGAMIQARSDGVTDKGGGGDFKKIHYFNSFFYEKLSKDGYIKAKLGRWTKRAKVDIFEKDLVIFPINLGNAHWTAAGINFEDKRFEYYDSMGDYSNARSRIFNNLRKYLQAEHMEKKGSEFDFEGWTDGWSKETPQQDNGSDCGVFTCQTLEALARGVNLAGEQWEFDASNMVFFRELMVVEIASGQLAKRW